MKKDKINIEKVTGTLLILCWITIIFCLILKLFGYKEFEIPSIDFNINHILRKIINGTLYCLNGYLFTLLLVKRKLSKKESLIIILINAIMFIPTLWDKIAPFKIIYEIIIYFIIGIVLIKDKWYKILFEVLNISLIFIFYQVITMIYKNINIKVIPTDFISMQILQIDYYLLIGLTIIYYFKKGGFTYGRWLSFLVFLSKRKSSKQSLSENNSSVQQSKEKANLGFKLFIIMLSIFQIALVGISCYFFNNTTIEYLIIILSFFIMRKIFGKSYHADSVIKCTTLSLIIFLCATKLSMPQYMTIICNVLIGCVVAYMMHVWYYYIKYTSSNGITLCKGMPTESLIELRERYNLNELEFNILNDYDVKRHKLERIANKYNYSIDGIKKIKGKIVKKINEF